MSPRIGTGVGVRYYTSFGPVRLDVGFPLNKRAGDSPFGIYVSIGQAF
jgi:translocation and assembly module TamA